MAGLCCSVNGNQPEGHGITFLPLKIVYKTPMEVAAYGKVIAQTVLNTCESCFDKSNTFLVISGSNAVFCDNQIAFEIFCHLTDDMF